MGAYGPRRVTRGIGGRWRNRRRRHTRLWTHESLLDRAEPGVYRSGRNGIQPRGGKSAGQGLLGRRSGHEIAGAVHPTLRFAEQPVELAEISVLERATVQFRSAALGNYLQSHENMYLNWNRADVVRAGRRDDLLQSRRRHDLRVLRSELCGGARGTRRL